MQQLVDQGVPIRTAQTIVAATYPETLGDTFYRHRMTDDPYDTAVGVYGLWNSLRGDQMPLGGTKVSDDARTIAQFLRLNGGDIPKIVHVTGATDHAVTTVCRRTGEAMARGDYFEPQPIEEADPKPDIVTDMHQAIIGSSGAGDYLRSLPLPNIG